ncbi:MAG: hypothetical protein F6K14_30910 [Symploca sp. SIO2C1]|nr:hypothetical protein [Symploca sp. SIO2C1]
MADIAYPLRFDGSGSIKLVVSEQQIQYSHTRHLCETSTRERLLKPNFGLPYFSFSSESDNQIVEERIKLQLSLYVSPVPAVSVDFPNRETLNVQIIPNLNVDQEGEASRLS